MISHELLEIGKIIRPHGLGGRMKVLSYLESQDILDGLREVYVGRRIREGAIFDLDDVQKGQESFVLKLRGIEDKDAADKMVGSFVWLPSVTTKKLPDGEYYWHEIIGLQVVTEDGQPLGTIESVFPTGSNDVYVCRKDKKEILLPAVEDVVRKVDTDRRIMVVRLLKGLTES
jgi:16S rRNA processing protein RimM